MIWGVGHANKRKAEEKLGVTTVGDLTKHPKGVLVRVFGPALGDKLWKAARGLDDTKLQPDQKRKSVSAEINVSANYFLSQPKIHSYMELTAAVWHTFRGQYTSRAVYT